MAIANRWRPSPRSARTRSWIFFAASPMRTTFTLGLPIIRIKDKSQIDKYTHPPRLGPTMEATRIFLRHNTMIEFNLNSALAWRAIGVRFWPARQALRGQVQTFARDRASAAHARPAVPGGGNSLRKAA